MPNTRLSGSLCKFEYVGGGWVGRVRSLYSEVQVEQVLTCPGDPGLALYSQEPGDLYRDPTPLTDRQTDRQTEMTDNITLTTPLAGSNINKNKLVFYIIYIY